MELIARTNVKKESGYLYFVDKQGDVSRARMARANTPARGPPEKVAQAGITRQNGYLYYVDKAGNISRSPMQRGGKTA